jgi:hypothetical protein
MGRRRIPPSSFLFTARRRKGEFGFSYRDTRSLSTNLRQILPLIKDSTLLTWPSPLSTLCYLISPSTLLSRVLACYPLATTRVSCCHCLLSIIVIIIRLLSHPSKPPSPGQPTHRRPRHQINHNGINIPPPTILLHHRRPHPDSPKSLHPLLQLRPLIPRLRVRLPTRAHLRQQQHCGLSHLRRNLLHAIRHRLRFQPPQRRRLRRWLWRQLRVRPFQRERQRRRCGRYVERANEHRL